MTDTLTETIAAGLLVMAMAAAAFVTPAIARERQSNQLVISTAGTLPRPSTRGTSL